MENETADLLAKKGLRIPCLPTALRKTFHNIELIMNQMYLDNGNSNYSNKKWVYIDIRGRSLHTLEHKEAVAKLRIFSGHDCLAHHLMRMNLIDSDICFLCNQNSIMNLYLFQCSHSIEKDNKQKISPTSTGKQEEKWCKIQNPSH